MANIRITELPESISASGSDILIVVNSGNPYATKKITVDNFKKQLLSVSTVSQLSAESYYAASGYDSNTLYLLTGEYDDIKIGSPFNQKKYSLFEDNNPSYLSVNTQSDVELYLTLSEAAKTSLSTLPRNYAYSDDIPYGNLNLFYKIYGVANSPEAYGIEGTNAQKDALFNELIASGNVPNGGNTGYHAEPLTIINSTQYKYTGTWSQADLKFKINKKEFGPYNVQVRTKGYSTFMPYSFKPCLKIRPNRTLSTAARAEIVKQWNGVESFTLNNQWSNPVSEIAQYKVFRKFGCQCPRAAYAKLFIKDPTKKIISVTNNTFTTNLPHYLDNDESIKLDLKEYSDEKFYIINRTEKTFQLSRTIGGNAIPFVNSSSQVEYFVNFGLYTNLEDLGKVQFDRMFGPDNTRNVYEIDPIVSSSDYSSMGKPIELNGNSSLYSLQYSSGVTPLDRSDINNFISKISDTSSSAETWYNNLLTCVNLPQVTRFFALESFVAQGDGLSQNNNNGYYHFDRNGKLSAIPWNMDSATFGGAFGISSSYFFTRLITNQYTRNAYVAELKNLSGVYLDFYTNELQSSLLSILEYYNTYHDDGQIRINGIVSSQLPDVINTILSNKNNISNNLNAFLNQPIPPTLSISQNSNTLTITISPVTKNVNNGTISVSNYQLQYSYSPKEGQWADSLVWNTIKNNAQANVTETINLSSSPYNQGPICFRAKATGGLYSEESNFYQYVPPTTTTSTTTTAGPTTTTSTTTSTTTLAP